MKKVVLMMILAVGLLANDKMMQSIYGNILMSNVNNALQSVEKLNAAVIAGDSKKSQKAFKQFAVEWKKVETFYLLGEFNEDTIDIPRYIDVFHNLKENLHVQMQRIIDSKDDLSVDMYKNSFKTINALEYVLFTKELNERKQEISKMIVMNLMDRLKEIKKHYEEDSQKFLTNFKWANDVIINMLIESSFKLKDWRIGDMAGLSRKYKGKPDNRRAEYFLSGTSKEAIKAIIELHKSVMDSPKYDFGDMLIENGFEKEVKIISNEIDNSLQNLKYLQGENFEAKEVKKLYISVSKLHVAYYQSLVNALGVTSKILDADGD